MLKILITDRLHDSIAEEQKVCGQYGLELIDHYCSTEDEIIQYGQDAVGLLVSYAQISKRIVESLPNLRIVVKYGVGVDNIDIPAATDKGIFVANVPDYCLPEVASFALAFILMGLKQIKYFNREMESGSWISQPKEKILLRPTTTTLGLIGFGRIARTLAEYARPMFKEIVFYDPYYEGNIPSYCRKVDDLKHMFSICQIISLHVPLTESSRNMIDFGCIEKANGLILVNIARAAVINFDALLKGLDGGNVLFYGADAFWEEPPEFSDKNIMDFLSRDNVVVTPHCAWCSLESEKEVRRKATLTIAHVVNGTIPDNILNANCILKQNRLG
jgi:D-3-phosphoglycerate dehydrogenase / 2-oxoglutarate reductase